MCTRCPRGPRPASRSSKTARVLLVLMTAAVLGAPSFALAQIPESSPLPLAASRVRLASATHVDEPPVVDGRLDEGMWQAASPLGDFVQADPLQGQPGSERT